MSAVGGFFNRAAVARLFPTVSRSQYVSASTVLVGTQAPPKRAGWALGLVSTGALTGSLIGPLVGELLPGRIGIRGTFFAGGAMMAVRPR